MDKTRTLQILKQAGNVFVTEYVVGQELLVQPPKPNANSTVPARRLGNPDGTPRTDLVRVRIVKIAKDTRRFTRQQIEDGCGPLGLIVTAEVIS